MIVYSIIKKSQLEGARRLDAEYYQPEYLEVAEKLKLVPHETIDGIAKSIVSFGAYALTSLIEWQESGIPFIVAENVKDGYLDLDGARFISEKVDKLLQKSRVQEGQILLSMSGSVGNAAVAHQVPARLNSNQDIVKITPKTGFSPYFIATFFNSKYGRMQILRLPVGSVQQHIFLWQIKTLLVPKFTQKEVQRVESLYKEGLKETENSRSLYFQAEQVLLEELGLRDFSVDAGLWSVVKFSEVKEVKRMDADYFEPRYQKLFKAIKKRNPQTLGELAVIKKGIEPGSEAYTEEGKPFIRVSSISKEGIGDRVQKFLSEEMYRELKKDYEPKVGEILLTKDASIGMACVVREQIEGIISGGILRLKPKEDIDSDYLALCFNSIVGQYQAERDAGGSIIKHWKPSEIKKVLIPVLPKPIQQKIADLVRASHAARKQAKELLEEAKRTVERLIEEGER